MKKAKSIQVKQQAESLWLQGYTLGKIATHLDLNNKTVEQWAYRYHWFDKRVELQEQARKTLYVKLIEQITQSAQRYLQGSLLISQMALEALNSLYEKIKKGEITHEECAEKILMWANILVKGSSIHKNVVPDASEQMSQQMLEEMRQINEKLLPREKVQESSVVDAQITESKELEPLTQV